MKRKQMLPLLFIPLLSYATTETSTPADEFESLLDEISEIATKKSLNVDYLPSVVTVIDAQTFRDAGIQNIGEALNMLPGIQMQINRLGNATTTIRGLKNPNAYRSDKIKVLIDGVAINNEAQGSASLYMDFPMQLVQKIEVLRGPGSTIYGAGAFYATVNIITRLGNSESGGQIFLGTGSYEDKTIATNVHEQIGNWKIYADAYQKSNDKRLNMPDGFSNNGTQTDEAMQDTTFGLKVTNGSFEFLTRYKENTYGNFYGYEEMLDPIGDQEDDHTNTYFLTQLSYKVPFRGYELETKVNYSNRKFETAANMGSVADTAGKFNTVGIVMQEGF
jgi:iron complex outermembrane receptor protein